MPKASTVMTKTSTLMRARTWVLLAAGVLAILGTLFGFINSHTRDKLEVVGMRIGVAEKDIVGHGVEIVEHRKYFGEVRERLARIETHQEAMVDKQDRILTAIEWIRDQ